MKLQNQSALITAEPSVVGAAVKIMAAGGIEIDERAAQKVSGLSPYMWGRVGSEVIYLMRRLSGDV